MKNIYKLNPPKFSFGATSAIITNLGIIIGLNSAIDAKFSIIGSLLVLALADNISDAIGIHVFQDSENLDDRVSWFSTLTNFLSRFLVSLIFIIFIFIFPINIATILSIIYGFLLLGIISYKIAQSRKTNPLRAIFEHLTIALIVIFASKYLGKWILNHFNR